MRDGLEYAGEYLYQDGFLTGEMTVTQRVAGSGAGGVFLFGRP